MKNDEYRKIWLNDQKNICSVALTPNEARFLTLLKNEPNTVNEISHGLNISTQATVQLGRQLIKKGYIDANGTTKPSAQKRGRQDIKCYVLREF